MLRIVRILAGAAIMAACFTGCGETASKWAPAGDRIRTVWAEQVSPSNVHPEYPRPQMLRPDWQSLNGLWKYAVQPSSQEQAPTEWEGDILVPFCIESSLSGVGRRVSPQEALWYSTSFKVPSNWSERVLLHFDAVDWQTDVWLNGIHVGTHTGGYTAFNFDVTDYLSEGSQELVVRVLDGTDNGEQPRGKQVSEPGGIWYTPVTGIWQSVWLEPVAETHLNSYVAVPDISESTVSVLAFIAGEPDEVTFILTSGGVGYSTESLEPGEAVAEVTVPAGKAASPGFAQIIPSATLKVDSPQLWTPETPYLYGLEILVRKDGEVVDRVSGYTALRESSEVRDSKGFRRLGLNGKPYFQFGPLDQGWWPDGLYTAPTDDALRFDIEKTKELGYNMIRKHIKVEPARWYWYCDRIGLAVWQDMPAMTGNLPSDGTNPQWGEWGYDTGFDYPLTETAKQTYYKEWGEIIAQLRNYPCILVWVPFNEAWSQFDTERAVEFTRGQDPTRLVNSASGGNSRHCGDILDSHNYPTPIMKFRSGGTQIDVLGEYGGIGLAVEGHLWQPENNWGYKGLCADAEEVLRRYTEFAKMFIPEIRSGVSAGVYTQTTDVEVEVNGLMTYDRKVVKMDPERLREVNRRIISAMDQD